MSKSVSHLSSEGEGSFSADRNIESVLILERVLERTGQQWVENLNTIEQYLVEIVETIGQRQPLLKSNYILRRLPMYTTSFTNKNEYAIVLNNIDFTLQNNRRYSTIEKRASPNFGQLEIFSDKSKPVQAETKICVHGREIKQAESQNIYKDVLNETNAFLSHEIFKKFASAFIRAGSPEPEEEPRSCSDDEEASSSQPKKQSVVKVQLISPHLLPELKTNKEVAKIFTIIPTARSSEEARKYGRTKTARCRISVNYLKSLLTISLEDTEVIVKPCLFLDKGYARVNTNLLDRIPLFHTNILNICEALGKGCLLFPTSYETLWALQFWPCESHLLCIYHPSSLISRIFKLFAAFSLNPFHFWETLNNCFLIGSDDMIASMADRSSQSLSTDFLLSAFLYEMEKYSSIEDWAPCNFYKRFIHLLQTSVDAYEKGFHPQYFTKINVLRGVWRDAVDPFEREESSILKELDDIEEFPEDAADSVEKSRDYLDQEEDDDYYGLHFDQLDTTEESDAFSHYTPTPLTSETVYKSVNPFQSVEDLSAHMRSKDRLNQNLPKKSKTLSKMFGSNLLRRFTSLGRSSSDAQGIKAGRARSMADITTGFAEHIAQNRREQTFGLQLRSNTPLSTTETAFGSAFDEEYCTTSTIKSSRKGTRGRSYSVPSAENGSSTANSISRRKTITIDNDDGIEMNNVHKAETIYSNILQILVDIPPSDHFSDSDVLRDLDRLKKILESQNELINEWCSTMSELPVPKTVCPHTFSPRQVLYISQIIKKTSRCSASAIKLAHTLDVAGQSLKIPAWEISGDLLRTVLHQMRSEPALHESFKEKIHKPIKRLSLKGLKMSLNSDVDSASPSSTLKKLSFKRRHSDACTGHLSPNGEETVDLAGETQFALEEPEIAATNRLLQWLWQLKTSNIGRLSFKAKKYLEYLHRASFSNSHFIEQFSEEKVFQSMAIRSAVAVSRIMRDDKLPAYVPLLAATKKGWLWAEMILSLASWNNEKGFPIEADIPNLDGKTGVILRDVSMSSTSISNTLKSMKGSEPDADAVTLAFHSELATPLGWNDFEDPRKPGPFTVPILIFSSLGYFKQWEMIPGNVVQVMVRLQRFSNLQHVGAMLFPPHRKTALNEVRKLNKSLSFRNFQFDNNVMSKTFKRLASLRSTRKHLKASSTNFNEDIDTGFINCQEMGCTQRSSGETEHSYCRGKQLQYVNVVTCQVVNHHLSKTHRMSCFCKQGSIRKVPNDRRIESDDDSGNAFIEEVFVLLKLNDFSRHLRCESFSNSIFAAEFYMSTSNSFFNPVERKSDEDNIWNLFLMDLGNGILSNAQEVTVPCGPKIMPGHLKFSQPSHSEDSFDYIELLSHVRNIKSYILYIFLENQIPVKLRLETTRDGKPNIYCRAENRTDINLTLKHGVCNSILECDLKWRPLMPHIFGVVLTSGNVYQIVGNKNEVIMLLALCS
ncbi:unnamed protein product [Allacma fusca]|uniref:Uncharacterized protein n=1 Tax=Allacma fusca TaxID=39272 RepID=A0A8J2P490_9HEXA|nr:unnamed protein product [Allacma fusca]